MSRPKVDKVFRAVAITAGGLLFGMAMVLATGGYWNIKGESASATVARLQEEYTKSPLVEAEESSETEVELNLDSVASLAVNDVTMNVKPGGDNVFVTGASEVWAMVKADAGYTILMSTEGSTLDNEDSETTVPTILSDTVGSNMPASSWGYHVGEVSSSVDSADDKALTYKPIPNNTSVTLSDWNGDDDNYTGWEIMDLGYGVNVAPTLESGSYARTVTITAVGKMWTGTLRAFLYNGGELVYDGATYSVGNGTYVDIPVSTGSAAAIGNPTRRVNVVYNNGVNASGATIDTTNATTVAEYPFSHWYAYSDENAGWDSEHNTYTATKGKREAIYASYSDPTIHLPVVTKQGYNCGWTYSSSRSTIDYANGSNYSGRTTFYAVCTTRYFTANIQTAGTGSLTRSANSINVPYNGSATVQITPSSTKITGASCTNGYTITPAVNNQTTATTFYIRYPSEYTENGTTCTFTGEELADNSFVDVEYMQDVESCPASKVTANTQYTLKDKRDEKEYKVARIGSQCWMTTNLNIAGGTVLDSINTNMSSGTTTLPASSTSGFSSYTASNLYNDADDTGEGTGGNGGYYSFRAAAANYNTGNYGGTVSQSICPKRWRLPTVDEFNTLISTYNTGAKLKASPWYGKYSGAYESSAYDGGGYGSYWASRYGSRYTPAYLYMSASSVYVSQDSYNYDANIGRSVRCIWSGS